MPPLRWLAGLRYDVPSIPLWAEGLVSGAAAQTRLSSGDERDLRICGSEDFPGLLLSDLGERCSGTPGWAQVEIRLGAEVAESVTLRLSLRNLTDARYRVHGSGTDAAGFSADANAVLAF